MHLRVTDSNGTVHETEPAENTTADELEAYAAFMVSHECSYATLDTAGGKVHLNPDHVVSVQVIGGDQ